MKNKNFNLFIAFSIVIFFIPDIFFPIKYGFITQGEKNILKSDSDKSVSYTSRFSFEKDTIVIKKDGSLCRSLGMTKDQSFNFAKRYGLKHYYHNGLFIVLVHPSDTFVRDWRPLKFK